MKFRKPKIEPMEMNLTPMIDCLLFLVVFLLLSTTFNQHSRLNLILPEATGVPASQQPKKIEVAISADGKYHVNGQALLGDGEAELMAALKQSGTVDTRLPLVIAADGKANHQSVVRVMDVAGKLGFVNINISTRVPVGERP